MKLYYMSGACSLAAHIALEWIGKPYEAVRLNFEQTKQPEFLKINPAGAVPALQETDGWVLTESPAILSYLAETHPEMQLGPDNTPRARAEFNRWLSHLTSDVHKSFVPIFAPQRMGADESQQDKIRNTAIERVRLLMTRLNEHMAEREHPIGNRNSVIDAYLFVFLRWTDKRAGGLDAFPHLQRFAKRMSQDTAVQKVLIEEGIA